MKIHKLWAENVRGISNRVNMDLSPTGLNLVTAPNEMGKTTMAQVLDFLFQHKSSANSKEIKDLKPYGKDVGPLMGATIEVDGQTYQIEKRWLKEKKTEVKLISPEIKELDGPEAEKMIDKIDPPRFFPLIGPAQLHHCHFKCTVYYKETIESGYPFPVKVTRPRVDVVYIDKDHLHLYVGSDPELQKSVTKDLVNY